MMIIFCSCEHWRLDFRFHSLTAETAAEPDAAKGLQGIQTKSGLCRCWEFTVCLFLNHFCLFVPPESEGLPAVPTCTVQLSLISLAAECSSAETEEGKGPTQSGKTLKKEQIYRLEPVELVFIQLFLLFVPFSDLFDVVSLNPSLCSESTLMSACLHPLLLFPWLPNDFIDTQKVKSCLLALVHPFCFLHTCRDCWIVLKNDGFKNEMRELSWVY